MTWPPELVAINHDDDHASFVGQTPNGNQFFLTTPFTPEQEGDPGEEFVALFLFDGMGNLVDAKIDAFGPRESMDEDARAKCFIEHLEGLGEVKYGRIEMKPFELERHGVRFGLIPSQPEEDESSWCVVLEPGDFMAFYAPWMDGEYYT